MTNSSDPRPPDPLLTVPDVLRLIQILWRRFRVELTHQERTGYWIWDILWDDVSQEKGAHRHRDLARSAASAAGMRILRILLPEMIQEATQG